MNWLNVVCQLVKCRVLESCEFLTGLRYFFFTFFRWNGLNLVKCLVANLTALNFFLDLLTKAYLLALLATNSFCLARLTQDSFRLAPVLAGLARLTLALRDSLRDSPFARLARTRAHLLSSFVRLRLEKRI